MRYNHAGRRKRMLTTSSEWRHKKWPCHDAWDTRRTNTTFENPPKAANGTNNSSLRDTMAKQQPPLDAHHKPSSDAHSPWWPSPGVPRPVSLIPWRIPCGSLQAEAASPRTRWPGTSRQLRRSPRVPGRLVFGRKALSVCGILRRCLRMTTREQGVTRHLKC